jgi:hypothetical protein
MDDHFLKSFFVEQQQKPSIISLAEYRTKSAGKKINARHGGLL